MSKSTSGFRYIRYIFRLIAAYISRFKAIIAISIILGVIVFASMLFLIPRIRTNVETIGVSGRYYSDTLPDSILALLSDGLTKIDESGFVVPAIAEYWETPDKGKTWNFKIKDGLVWHDGTPITSQTIQYEFTDVTIERPDDETIVFKLDQPFSPFPSVVSQPVFKKGLLGMKDWKVQNISVAGTYIEKLQLVHTDKRVLVYRFYPTTDRTKLAYKLGEVDKIIDLYEITPFETWKTARIEKSINKEEVVTIFFNTQDPILGEKSIRQALSYAIDKEALGQRALSTLPDFSWAFNPQVKPYDYDQERAKELISALPKEERDKLAVKLSTSPLLLPVAEKIANDWRAVGVQTSVQISTTNQTDYQALLTMYGIPKDPDQYSIWHSTQVTTNISHYSSPRIDKLLEDGRTLIDTEERRQVYLDFQRFLLEDVPAIFLYHPVYYSVSRS